jgi:NADH-quinone oxidoreductase subunit G
MNATTEELVTIYVENLAYQVKTGGNLLEACLGLAKDLPYFCWHPALGSVGSCRQCAVQLYQNEEDQHGRMVMACMTPIAEGMRVSLSAPMASQFRQQCIEVTMANHPHDCPVCEEGGECHLQDMTLQSGHTQRRYKGAKKTYNNQDLGPCVGHEMNRCISCYRCVRFYQDYAGGDDLVALGSSENMYFGRHEDGCLTSHFSGNLAEVCPTGVFYDKVVSDSYTRKWDLQSAPSICSHCSLGCNLSVGERQGRVKRVTNRYHNQVNGYFICDKGRYGFAHSNSEKMLYQAQVKPLDESEKITCDSADGLDYVAQIINELGPENVFGLGSPKASVEENFSLQSLVGKTNFYAGQSDVQGVIQAQVLHQLNQADIHSPSLKQIEQADAIIILGEDLLHTAPRMAMSVRQASRNLGFTKAAAIGIPKWQDEPVRIHTQNQLSPIISITSATTDLDDISSQCLQLTPHQMCDYAKTLTRAIDGQLDTAKLPTKMRDQVQQSLTLLTGAKRPLVISGASSQSSELIDTAAQLALALGRQSNQKAWLSYCLEAANSMGLGLLNKDAKHMGDLNLRLQQQTKASALIVLQTDLFALSTKAATMCESVRHLIVVDHLPNPTSDQADVVIACANGFETEGTYVNNEGRAQRFFAVHDTPGRPDAWRSLANLARMLSQTEGCSSTVTQLANCTNFDHLCDLVGQQGGFFTDWCDVAPSAGFRVAGMKIPRQSHRASGRTSLYAHKSVSEAKQPEDFDSALAFTMEGTTINTPSALIPQVWSPGWNSNEAINKFQQEINGPLKGGEAGLRLFDNHHRLPSAPNTLIPSISIEVGQILAHSQSFLFGSDQASHLSSALKKRSGAPSARIHPDTAIKMGLAGVSAVCVELAQAQWHLPLTQDASMAKELLLLPNHYQAPISVGHLPAAVNISPLKQEAL